MKVLIYNYKTDQTQRKLAFAHDSDANKLFNDIMSARNDNINTLAIFNGDNKLIVSPCEMLEVVLSDQKGNTDEYQ